MSTSSSLSRLTQSSPVWGSVRFSESDLVHRIESAYLNEYVSVSAVPNSSRHPIYSGYEYDHLEGQDESIRDNSKKRRRSPNRESRWRQQSQVFNGELLVDGLPGNVWLECIEPTLSILISLNALRHRKCNLTIKKGLPEHLDSNNCRHGDFGLGPPALAHQHTDELHQLMIWGAYALDDEQNEARPDNLIQFHMVEDQLVSNQACAHKIGRC